MGEVFGMKWANSRARSKVGSKEEEGPTFFTQAYVIGIRSFKDRRFERFSGSLDNYLLHGWTETHSGRISPDGGRGAPDLLHSRIIRPFDWSMVHESEKSPVCGDGLDADDHAYRRILREGYTRLDILDPVSVVHIVRFLRAGRHTSDRKNSRLL